MNTKQQKPRWVRRPPGANWGDFGPDDQLGRMNLITQERRRDGIAEAKEGLCFNLSLPLDYPGGSELAAGMRNPPRLFASEMGDKACYNNLTIDIPDCPDISCDDGVVIFSQYSTQWDSLAHWGQEFDADGDGEPEKVYYNGYRAGEHLLSPEAGGPYAHALGMEHMAQSGAQGRGVLVDLSMLGSAVGYDALMRALDEQQVEVRTGDFFCLHTGVDEMLLAMNKSPDVKRIHDAPGLDGQDERLLRWIDESGVAAICSDNIAIEHFDLESYVATDHHGRSFMPIHELCLFKLGIHLGELWLLSELKAALKARGRSAFLVTAPPWRLPGSVGSPVNPVGTI